MIEEAVCVGVDVAKSTLAKTDTIYKASGDLQGGSIIIHTK